MNILKTQTYAVSECIKEVHNRKCLNFEKLCIFLCKSHHGNYLEIASIMPPHNTFFHRDLPLLYETNLFL